jgi:hypothetical protein
MLARILLVGILACIAVFVITALLMFLAPYIAIAFIGWLVYRVMKMREPTSPKPVGTANQGRGELASQQDPLSPG